MSTESRERRQRCLAVAICLCLVVLSHLFLVLLTLGARTSCAWPPCHDSWAFAAWRWLVEVPLFVTPWFDLPIEEERFAWSARRVSLVVGNSLLAAPSWLALGRGVAWLCRQAARRISRSRASSACNAGRGT